MPARDEAHTIDPAVASLLAQDYPNLQVVLVDDRSTDETGTVIDRLAATDPRVAAVHVRELPDGWLGKVHALQRGVERASGNFVLFTDADILFAPGVLRRAIAWSEAERLDHLAVLAEVTSPSVLVAACIAASSRGLIGLARPWEATDPRSAKAIGTGAFNLVRRSAFERTPGFEWLRLEVADDIGLGLMMKRWGGRPGLLIGRGQVRLRDITPIALRRRARSLRGRTGSRKARASPAWRGSALVWPRRRQARSRRSPRSSPSACPGCHFSQRRNARRLRDGRREASSTRAFGAPLVRRSWRHRCRWAIS